MLRKKKNQGHETLQEEVREFVHAAMYRQLQPEQLRWWQDSLKHRCRLHRFSCRTWFQFIYDWQPTEDPQRLLRQQQREHQLQQEDPGPDPNQLLHASQEIESAWETAVSQASWQAEPTQTYATHFYIPVMMRFETSNAQPASRSRLLVHRV